MTSIPKWTTKKRGFPSGGQTFNNGARNTIQTLANVSNASSVLFDGGSPIVFGAAYDLIVKEFVVADVFYMIALDDGQLDMNIEEIVESNFNWAFPDEQDHVENLIQDAIDRADAVRDETYDDIQELGLPEPDRLQARFLVTTDHRKARAAAMNMRPTLLKNLHDRQQEFYAEQEKFYKRQATILKCFYRVFGVTVLSTVNNLLAANRFRAAWHKINNDVRRASAGQNNASIVLNELSNVYFNGSTMSFSTLEGELTMIYRGMEHNGDHPPSDETKLHHILEAIKKSPGKEYTKQVDFIQNSAMGFEESMRLLHRRSAEIATTGAFQTVKNNGKRQRDHNNEHQELLNYVKQQKALNQNQNQRKDSQKSKKQKVDEPRASSGRPPCEYCGLTNHYTNNCYQGKVCSGCNEVGHVRKDCTKGDAGRGQGKNTTQNSTGESSNNVGNRFNATNASKKNNEYLFSLDLSPCYNEYQHMPMTDHHASMMSLNFFRFISTLAVLATIRIILDSGATAHMMPENIILKHFCARVGSVQLGDSKTKLTVKGVGDTLMQQIDHVLRVQGLRMGILSISVFDKKHYTTVFANRKAIVYDGQRNIVLCASLNSEGMYELDSQYVDIIMGNEVQTQRLNSVSASTPSATADDQSDSEDELCNINTKPLERVDIPVGSEYYSNRAKHAMGSSKPKINESETNCGNEMNCGNIRTGPSCNKRDCNTSSNSSTNMGKNFQSLVTPRSIPRGSMNSSTVIDKTSDNREAMYSMSTTMGLNPLEILHRQWGHLGANNIKKALKNNMVKGCKFTYEDVKNLEIRLCTECMQGRMKAKSESATTDHKWQPLEKIAIDYKGNFARQAVGKFKGFMLLVDYATNFVYADLVMSKNEHTRVLKDYMRKVVKKYNRIWRVLQSDSESIFKSTRVTQWLRKEMIRLQLSTPYQHWQNGQVEVYVGIVMDRARTIMTTYNTPIKFWGYAILYVCYTMNRTPTSGSDITPYEAIVGTPPNISNMVPFFAPGVYHLTHAERKDPWVPKAKPCRMLGYADEYLNAYHILNVETGKVIVRENCIFDISLDAQEVDEIEVNRELDRDDVSEFEILIDNEKTDNIESDDESIESDIEVNSLQGDENSSTNSNTEAFNSMLGDLGSIDEDINLFLHWKDDVAYTMNNVLALPKNPKSVDEALQGEHKELWQEAITKELDQFRIRNTFGTASQSGRGMKTKLILYYKYDGEYNLVCKARLVVCGYSQRKGIDYFDTYSPTTTTSTVFILLCIAGVMRSHVGSFDISAAFLEGRSDTKMFAWLPPEIDSEGVSQRIEILGNWYGSKQAGKIWNDLFHSIVITLGFVQSVDNPCLYKWTHDTDYIYLTVHVDDGLFMSSSKTVAHEFFSELLKHVRKAVMYDSVQLYLAMDITRSSDGSMFHVSQERYVVEACAGCTRNYQTPMTPSTNLRIAEPNEANSSLLPDTGKLRYLADRTRPDILVALGEVSTGGADKPSDDHMSVMERIKGYLYNTKHKTLSLGGNGPVELFGYCDASYISTGNCKSRLGSCLFINRDSGAISSVSKNDTTVSHSSTEPEIKAIDMICREIVYLRSMLEYLGYDQKEPTKIYVDNKSAIELCRTLKVRHNVGHINVRINYIRELINARVIELVFIPSRDNVADALTKALNKEAHVRHTEVLLHGHNCSTQTYETYEHYMNIVSNLEAANSLLESI